VRWFKLLQSTSLISQHSSHKGVYPQSREEFDLLRKDIAHGAENTRVRKMESRRDKVKIVKPLVQHDVSPAGGEATAPRRLSSAGSSVSVC